MTIWAHTGNAPAYLERGTATYVDMRVEADFATTAITGGAVEIFTPAGASLGSTSVSTSAGTAYLSPTIASSNDYGSGYSLVWSLTYSGGAIPKIRQSAVVCAARPWPPVTHAGLLQRNPTLTDYPAGKTSWAEQMEQAWYRLIADLAPIVGHRIDQVLPLSETRDAYLAACMAYIHEVRATTAGSSAAAAAEAASDAYQDLLKSIRLPVDTDDDGLVEDTIGGIRTEWPGPSGRRVS
mgnify:CR=1 FL=1